jgi:hypothetical protein
MSRKEGIFDSDRCDSTVSRWGVCGGGYTVYGGQSFGSFFTKYVTRKEVIFDACAGGCRDGIFKLLRSESISPGYIGWRAGTATLFLLGS